MLNVSVAMDIPEYQGPKERKHVLSESETLLRMDKNSLVNKSQYL